MSPYSMSARTGPLKGKAAMAWRSKRSSRRRSSAVNRRALRICGVGLGIAKDRPGGLSYLMNLYEVDDLLSGNRVSTGSGKSKFHVGGGDAGARVGFFAILHGGPAHVALHVGQTGATGASPDVRAGGAHRQFARADGADVVHLRRVAPDIQKLLPADVAGGQRELHAGEHVPVGRDVAISMAGAAGHRVEVLVPHGWRRGAEFVHVAHQIGVMHHVAQLL